MNEVSSLNLLSKYKTENIPAAENLETDCDGNVVAETAAVGKDFVVFGDEVKEEAFGDACVDGSDVLLKLTDELISGVR